MPCFITLKVLVIIQDDLVVCLTEWKLQGTVNSNFVLFTVLALAAITKYHSLGDSSAFVFGEGRNSFRASSLPRILYYALIPELSNLVDDHSLE